MGFIDGTHSSEKVRDRCYKERILGKWTDIKEKTVIKEISVEYLHGKNELRKEINYTLYKQGIIRRNNAP